MEFVIPSQIIILRKNLNANPGTNSFSIAFNNSAFKNTFLNKGGTKPEEALKQVRLSDSSSDSRVQGNNNLYNILNNQVSLLLSNRELIRIGSVNQDNSVAQSIDIYLNCVY